MYPDNVSLTDDLKQAHAQSWQTLAAAGDFFTGAERVGFVRCAREALTCSLCRHKKESLSPNTLSSVDNKSHDGDSQLDATIVDMIHRIRTDPGRLTKSWFDDVTKIISKQQYVEIVSVVTSSVIIDTLHNALGLGLPSLPIPISGRPRRQFNDQAVEGGAWVPMLAGVVTSLPLSCAHGLASLPSPNAGRGAYQARGVATRVTVIAKMLPPNNMSRLSEPIRSVFDGPRLACARGTPGGGSRPARRPSEPGRRSRSTVTRSVTRLGDLSATSKDSRGRRWWRMCPCSGPFRAFRRR